jgi:hypothetical protein
MTEHDLMVDSQNTEEESFNLTLTEDELCDLIIILNEYLSTVYKKLDKFKRENKMLDSEEEDADNECEIDYSIAEFILDKSQKADRLRTKFTDIRYRHVDRS